MPTDEKRDQFKAFAQQLSKPKKLTTEEWEQRRRERLSEFSTPFTVQIVCSHKDGALLKKRPVTLGEAIVELDQKCLSRVELDWNPIRGNMRNRTSRKGSYHPVAIDEAVPPTDGDNLADHDIEGLRRSGVKGMAKVKRNAVTNYYADQLICPRCTMHVSRNDSDLKRLLTSMAKDGMAKLDIQHIDFYMHLL